MPVLYLNGFETGHVLEANNTVVGAVSLSTSVTRPGSAYSLRLNPANGSAEYPIIIHDGGATVTRLRAVRFYMRVAAFPSVGSPAVIMRFGNTVAHISLNSNGTLNLENSTRVIQSTSTTALALNTWYLIEFNSGHLTGAIGRAVLVDGVVVCEDETGTYAAANAYLAFGSQTASTMDVYIDDVAGNDRTLEVDRPATYYLTMLKPTSDIALNSWTLSGGETTNVWNGVDNVPPVGSTVNTAGSNNRIKNVANPAVTLFYEAQYPAYNTFVGATDVVHRTQICSFHAQAITTGDPKSMTMDQTQNPVSTYSISMNAGKNSLNVSTPTAMGTFPVGWAFYPAPAIDASTVVKTTPPRARIGKTNGGNREVDAAQLGLYVMWGPQVAPATPVLTTNFFHKPTGSGNITFLFDPVTGATGYRLYQNNVLVDDKPSPELSVTGRTLGTTYTYRITAYNPVGESPSATFTQLATNADTITFTFPFTTDPFVDSPSWTAGTTLTHDPLDGNNAPGSVDVYYTAYNSQQRHTMYLEAPWTYYGVPPTAQVTECWASVMTKVTALDTVSGSATAGHVNITIGDPYASTPASIFNANSTQESAGLVAYRTVEGVENSYAKSSTTSRMMVTQANSAESVVKLMMRPMSMTPSSQQAINRAKTDDLVLNIVYDPDPPHDPVVTVAQLAADGVRFTWDEVVGASEYQVYRDGQQVASFTNYLRRVFVETGLESSTSYSYRVVAVRDGVSSISPGFTVTTPAYVDYTSLMSALHVDATKITGVADGASLASIANLATFTRNVTNGTSTTQPRYKASAINGLPGIDFTASNARFLTISAPINASTNVNTGGLPTNTYEGWYVVMPTAIVTNSGAAHVGTMPNIQVPAENPQSNSYWQYGGNTNWTAGSALPVNNKPVVIHRTVNWGAAGLANTLTVYSADNPTGVTTTFTTTNTTNTVGGANSIGSSGTLGNSGSSGTTAWPGYIGEVFVTPLNTAGRRARVTEELLGKWLGLPVTPIVTGTPISGSDTVSFTEAESLVKSATVFLDIYDGDTLIRTEPAINLITDSVQSLRFNRSDLIDPTGAGLRIRVRSTGRVDIGAVEWNAAIDPTSVVVTVQFAAFGIHL